MKAFVAIVFIAAFIDFGNAIKCYDCAGDASCADPFTSGSSVKQKDCSLDNLYENVCWKTSWKDGSVTRSCSFKGVCSLSGIGCVSDQGVSVCCCNGNLCNSASTTGISYVTFASLLIASFLGMM